MGYLLIDEDGNITYTETEPKNIDGCSWPRVVRLFVTCGDYSIEAEELCFDNVWRIIEKKDT